MPDRTDEIARRNLYTIDLSKAWQRHFWTTRLFVTESELRAAVANVGTNAEDVMEELKIKRRERWKVAASSPAEKEAQPSGPKTPGAFRSNQADGG